MSGGIHTAGTPKVIAFRNLGIVRGAECNKSDKVFNSSLRDMLIKAQRPGQERFFAGYCADAAEKNYKKRIFGGVVTSS